MLRAINWFHKMSVISKLPIIRSILEFSKGTTANYWEMSNRIGETVLNVLSTGTEKIFGGSMENDVTKWLCIIEKEWNDYRVIWRPWHVLNDVHETHESKYERRLKWLLCNKEFDCMSRKCRSNNTNRVEKKFVQFRSYGRENGSWWQMCIGNNGATVAAFQACASYKEPLNKAPTLKWCPWQVLGEYFFVFGGQRHKLKHWGGI